MFSYELDREIKQAFNIIDKDYCDTFDKIYPLINENINGYIKEFNLKDKSLVTVGSSSDQIINAVLYGCRDIKVIDLCPFVKHYFNLKKSALLTLNYDQYQKYFCELIGSKTNSDLFDKKIYLMLRDKLGKIDYLSLLFWDTLYNKYSSKMIRYRLFQDGAFESGYITKYSPYLMSEADYDKLKLKIRNIHPSFINGNILDLNYYLENEKIDNVFLSNVYDYLKDDKINLQQFKILITKINNMLNDGGKALISYLYGTNTNDNLDNFKNNNLYPELRYETFTGVRGLYFNDDTKDTAVILEKKKK